eukprot:sb/3469896/
MADAAQAANAQIAALTAEFEAYKTTLQAESDKLKKDLENANGQIESLTAELKASKIERETASSSEGSMSSAVDVSAEMAEQLQVVESQLQTVREECDKERSEKVELEGKVATLESELNTARESMLAAATTATPPATVDSSAAEEEVERLREELSNVQSQGDEGREWKISPRIGKKMEPANSFTNVSQMVPRNTKKFWPARDEGQRVHFRVYMHARQVL